MEPLRWAQGRLFHLFTGACGRAPAQGCGPPRASSLARLLLFWRQLEAERLVRGLSQPAQAAVTKYRPLGPHRQTCVAHSPGGCKFEVKGPPVDAAVGGGSLPDLQVAAFSLCAPMAERDLSLSLFL